MRSNGKWTALSEKLRAAGWPENLINPRILESQYHASKAVMCETKAEVGDREIIVFGSTRFTGEQSKYEARLWFRGLDDLRYFEVAWKALVDKIPLRTTLTLVSITVEDQNREGTHHPIMVQVERGGGWYPEDYDWENY